MRWVMLALLFTFADAPAIRHLEGREEPFEVTYASGAVWACTHFESTTQTLETTGADGVRRVGPYTPAHCWGVDETSTSYGDDWAFILPTGTPWVVWAEIYYPRANDDPEKIETNRVRVTY